ncbi:MAG: AsmA family protein [Rhodospirillaceae bacterium]
MTPITRRLIRWVEAVGALAVALVAAVGVFLWYLNANDYRRDIVAAVEQATGLVVSIDGPLRFALTPLPTAIAADVRIANPPWSERTEMARIGRVEIGFSPIDLLVHRNRLLRLALYGADLYLERDRHGRVNWWNAETAVKPPPTGYEPPDIDSLELFNSRLFYVDAGAGRTLRLGIREAAVALPLNRPFTVAIGGDYFGTPFTGSLTGGRYADLINDRSLWPLALRLAGAGTILEARGTVDRPMSEMIVDVTAAVAGLRLASLTPVLGQGDLPALGPYRLSGRFSGGWGHYRLAGLKAHLGVSDAVGQLTITTGGARPRLEGQLQSRLFSRADLVGAGPPAPAAPADDRLFDPRPLPFAALTALDGRLELRVGRFVVRPLDLFDIDTTLELTEGRLRALPFRARLAEGRLDLHLEADARARPARVHLWGSGDGLASEQLLPALGMSQWPTGPMALEFDLTGEGDSPRALLAHADGAARMTIGQGTLPVRHFDLIASDLVASIMPWADRSGDRTDLNCLVTRLKLKDGLAAVDRLLIDTGKITVTGTGEINLASERFDLRLDPRPKDPSLISLATRMRVAGSLTNYGAAPDAMGLAKGAAAGIALAIGELNPLALMLPFVSIGTGVANPCPGAAAAQAQVRGLAALDPLRGITGLLDDVGRAITHSINR